MTTQSTRRRVTATILITAFVALVLLGTAATADSSNAPHIDCIEATRHAVAALERLGVRNPPVRDMITACREAIGDEPTEDPDRGQLTASIEIRGASG